LALEDAAQGSKAAALQGFDRARGLAESGSGLVDGEPGHDPQDQHVALVWDEVLEQGPDALGSQRLGDGVVDVVGGVGLGSCAKRLEGRPAADTAPFVEQAPMGDGEHPGTELGFVAAEAMEVAQHPEEHLAGQVVGLRCSLGAEVGSDHGGQSPEDPIEGPRLAPVGRINHLVELPIEPVSPALPRGFIPVIAGGADTVTAHVPSIQFDDPGIPTPLVPAESMLTD
jgi:hypothetical protein